MIADISMVQKGDTEVCLVNVGCARVLEMRNPDRNPDEGQDPAPAAKSRYQYVRAGGHLWTRHLPPIGDAWADTGVPRWEMMAPRDPALRSVIDDYYDAAPPDISVLVVRRQPDDIEDDIEAEIIAGPITDAWWDVPLPPCPDCGGDLVWHEAGYVPGTRICMGCGSLFSVRSQRRRAIDAGVTVAVDKVIP